MKDEWRKSEKEIYLPKQKPILVNVTEFQYIVLSGKGNPNSKSFSKCIQALYSVAYAINDLKKNGTETEKL